MCKNGAVASAHELATDAGLAIIEKGGNAVDAAIATALTLSVVDPQNSGLGGYGGLALIYSREKNEVSVVDFNTKAPIKSTQDMFVASSNMSGKKAVSIPGVLRGLTTLSENFGKMPISTCFEPSVVLAEEGFPINKALFNAMQEHHLDDETKKTFQIGKLREGDILKRPDYAKTLKLIQSQGDTVFYEGEIAEKIISTLGDDLITKEDLANYKASIKAPGRISYCGYDVHFPLMNSGGTTMAQILKIAENFEFNKLSEIEMIKLAYEIMGAAFHDRFAILENPDCTDNDALGLINEKYCHDIATKISAKEYSYNIKNVSLDVNHTTHLCTIDNAGNMVSMTLTNGPLWFGSGVTVKDTGIVLNNGMALFNIDPKHPNSPRPNCFPLTNMCPVIVVDNNKPYLAVGSPGARRIITIVASVIFQTISLGKTLKEALDNPRIHAEGLTLWVENNFPRELLKIIKNEFAVDYLSLGDFYGSTTAIQVIGNKYYPEVDKRFPGFAKGF